MAMKTSHLKTAEMLDFWDMHISSHWIMLRMVSHYFLTLFGRLSTKTQVKEYASEAKYRFLLF